MPVQAACMVEKLNATHPRQVEIGCDQRHLFAAASQLRQGVESGCG
jgi:hypothetical protein